MNIEINPNNIDDAIDGIAMLIEQDNRTPTEAIATILAKFNIPKDCLLTAFETAFCCKPNEYVVICDEERNINDDQANFPDSIDSEFDDVDIFSHETLTALI